VTTFPSLAIVVVSYNSASDLPECLSTLLDNVETYPAPVQVALVENGGERAKSRTFKVIEPFLKRNLCWLPGPTNLGYGGGANYGWENMAGEIDIVLNPDMSFPPGWLEKYVRCFMERPDIGIAGCKLLNREGNIQHVGGVMNPRAMLGQHFGYEEPDDGRFDDSKEVDYVTGAALAIRRELREKLGGFDIDFFPGYYEDVDLSLRALKLGWKTWCEAGAVAYHYEGSSFGRTTGFYTSLYRNRLRLAQKHMNARQFFTEFVPAEIKRISLTPPSHDLDATLKLYRDLSQNFRSSPGYSQIIKNGDNMHEENPLIERLPSRMMEVKKRWLVEEKPFYSRIPFIANLRERFNNISTRWYVKPILAQQVEYNAAVARAIEDLSQLALATETSRNLELAALAERFSGLEERLSKIETLLEKVLDEKENA
jgi:GT2 family glycosyltransferase